MNPKINLTQINQATSQSALKMLKSQSDGLTARQRAQRLAEYGPNQIQQQRQRSILTALWQSVEDPFIAVLAVLMVISWVSRDTDGAIVMAIMILVSSSIRFIQERQSEKASLALQTLLSKNSRVQIAGQRVIQAAESLVPGDIVDLQTGDLVNADLYLLVGQDVQVNQASLTGESKPVFKKTTLIRDESNQNVADLQRILLMGSTVVNGQVRALVVATGQQTEFSAIVTTQPKQPLNQFDSGLKKISWLLIRLMLVLVPVVFLINGLTKGDWQQSFFFAIAVAVGLTPQMLPMIVNINLAKGSVTLNRQKVIVKQLKAIQNLGAMSVLCTDKTGTLTEDHIKLMYYADASGQRDVQTLRLAYLNARGQSGWHNLLDEAIIDYYEQSQPNHDFPYTVLGEIPFNFESRRLTVWLSHQTRNRLVTKGAFAEVLATCNAMLQANQVVELTPTLKQQLEQVHDRLAQQGMRVLGVAYRDDLTTTSLSDDQVTGLVFAGFLGFLDPPKKSAITAIQQLQAHQVAVKILTGDSALTTQQVAQQVGIQNLAVTTGDELQALSDEKVSCLLQKQALFAKLAPLQKARLIRLLQAQGAVVGFLGDGINDTTALKQADVGISVANAADLTKEASDIILLEKDLNVLESGVLEGRRIFINMQKYIRMTLASNFGNVLSVLVASLFLPFLPMLSIQILVQNLLYDIAQLWLPWDRVADQQLRQPSKWTTKGLLRSTLILGPISSLVDIVTFAILWFGFNLQTVGQQGHFQASWFVVGLLTQMLVVYVLRTPNSPFKDRAAGRVYLGSALSLGVAALLVLTPLRQSVDFKTVPNAFWPVAAVLIIGYLGLTNWIKRLI